MATITRWYGLRRSTKAKTDEDRAMATVNLGGTANEGFTTREEARQALLRLIADESVEIAGYSDLEALTRLTKIMQQLLANPTHNSAEVDGLWFGVFPVERPVPATS